MERITVRDAEMAAAYRSGLTLAEVGQKFGLTKQRVSKILQGIPGLRLRPRGPTKSGNPALYLRGSSPCSSQEG